MFENNSLFENLSNLEVIKDSSHFPKSVTVIVILVWLVHITKL